MPSKAAPDDGAQHRHGRVERRLPLGLSGGRRGKRILLSVLSRAGMRR